MALRESRDAKDFKKLKIGQREMVKNVVSTTKEDLYKKGKAKLKFDMIHQPDWHPVTSDAYRGNYDNIKWK